MTSQVVGSDFTAGAQLPNYVNGRLLTAEDLATSQATLRARDRKLGQAAGHGVVDGLWVTFSATTITVAPGLGVAPSGEAVSVPAAVALPLTFAATATPGSSGSFSCCTPTEPGAATSIGVGCYLLTALPACQLSGQAPMAAASTGTASAGTTSAGCAAQWKVEGVQFKAITLPLGESLMGITVTDDNRRNLLAHWCLGSAQLALLGADPFNFAPAYGGFDTLDPTDLTPADLPLAVFYFDGKAIDFVDNWSARRRITAPDAARIITEPNPVTASWSALTTDRRDSDGAARLLQFQDQAADQVASGAAGTIAAETTFPLLPPVGFLPLGPQHASNLFEGIRVLAATATPLVSDAAASAVHVAAGEALVAPAAAVAGERPAPPAITTNLPLFAADHQAVLAGINAIPQSQLDTISSTLAATPAQSGFNLTAFFGAAAVCGGILDWEIVDFALRQSWRSAAGQPAPPPDASAQAPYTWFLVLQNVNAGSLGSGGGPSLYVVFIKTLTWLTSTRLPFTTSSPPSVVDRLLA